MARKAISLFCSSGIGDLGLRANGIDTVAACEMLPERSMLFMRNYPATKMFCGDIWTLQNDITNYYADNFREQLFMVLATPPCQGMSSNGMGTMLRNYKKGIRPKFDERNRLIIPSLNIIKKLRPLWAVFENVPNMSNTYILDEHDRLVNIIDYIRRELGPDYMGREEIVDVADYGIPQHRRRLLTIFSRDEKVKQYFSRHHSFLPCPTHSKDGDLMTKRWVTLRACIGQLPPISSKKGDNVCPTNPLHKVPVLDTTKLYWIENTPEGQTAFNNQCVNPQCRYQQSPTHGARHDTEGVNRANADTPLYCARCGSLLPRPWVVDKKTGEKRIMKGFTSAYKRMSWDEPCSTLTQNFQYACSDNKLHPKQNRVLSLYEGMIIQTIADYDYSFFVGGQLVNDGLIRDTIGESIPPRFMDMVIKNIVDIY